MPISSRRGLGLGGAFALGWKVLQWPVVFALVTVAIGIVNYFGPDADQDWVWITPGAVLSTFLWLVASLAFKLYVTNFSDYNATYGSLGGAIVLMLWFYISALALLFGSELNAEIEHASPHGKAPGEKVPGERKKIGPRAARAFEEQQRRGTATGASPAPSPRPPSSPPDLAQPTATTYVILAAGLVMAGVRKLRNS